MDSRPERTLFSTSDSLGRFFGEVTARPLQAARLLLIDAIVLGGLGLAVGLAQFREGGATTSALIAAGVIFLVAYWQSSHAAWLRFLMDCERPGPIPHRLGKDEIRLFALHVLAMVFAVLVLIVIVSPGYLLNVLGAPGLASFWALCSFLALGVLATRFLPLAPLMILEGAFRPFALWRAAKRIWGRLIWAGFTLLLFYAGAILVVGILNAAAGRSFRYTAGQFDLGLPEMSREAFQNLATNSAEPGHLALLLAIIVLRIVWIGMLRGIGAEAALALHAGGELSGARADEPGSPPSSAHAPGSAPEPV